MQEKFSRFAHRFVGQTGTRLLMDDLGDVLSQPEAFDNLGGGNPAAIPGMQALFRSALETALKDGSFDRLSGAYDGPQGHRPLLEAVALLMRSRYGWPVGPENVAMTAGSQSSFLMLFNLLAGLCADGIRRHILLPLTPEYIGYADLAVEPGAIRSFRPRIEELGEREFKYRVDFDRFRLTPEVGAVCVSRPTNPTGNVLSAAEMSTLARITADAGVPFIIDNAYGVPFPGIVFDDVEPLFGENVIYCLSLSKLGLPGLRTGIVIARAEIIEALTSMNAIFTLASGSLGASLVSPLIASGRVLELAQSVLRPYYEARVRKAIGWCDTYFDGLNYRRHRSEGAIFLWLWFPGLPIDAQELYRRLKERRVLVIPGHYFFPGLEGDWLHRHECIRISYAQSPEQVERGIRTIAEEVRRAFAAA